MAPRIASARKSRHAAHTHLHEQLRDVRFFKPDRADGTKINIARILRKWKMYGPFSEKGRVNLLTGIQIL